MEAISMDQVKLLGAIKVDHILTLSAKAVANEHAIMRFEAVLDQEEGKKLIGKSLSQKIMRLICNTQEEKQKAIRPNRTNSVPTTLIQKTIRCSQTFY